MFISLQKLSLKFSYPHSQSCYKLKLLRNRHSAVESNINELECRGLDRCPDRGYNHFKRYVGLAVAAYNLRRIGQELIAIRKKRELAERELRTAA